jgi:hypothetical protein
MKEQVKEAKRNLYYLLLQMDIKDISDNEATLLFQLANDEQIKEFLKS